MHKFAYYVSGRFNLNDFKSGYPIVSGRKLFKAAGILKNYGYQIEEFECESRNFRWGRYMVGEIITDKDIGSDIISEIKNKLRVTMRLKPSPA